MRYCHKIFFEHDNAFVTEKLIDLIDGHAYRCAGNTHDDWDDEWDDNTVIIRFRCEEDAVHSAQTFEREHAFSMRMFAISQPLYLGVGPVYEE